MHKQGRILAVCKAATEEVDVFCGEGGSPRQARKCPKNNKATLMVQRAKKRKKKHQRNRKGNREGEKRKVSNLHMSRNPSKQDVERDPARCSKQPPYRTATEVEMSSERKRRKQERKQMRGVTNHTHG